MTRHDLEDRNRKRRDRDALDPRMCLRCGLNGNHRDAETCIARLRDLVAVSILRDQVDGWRVCWIGGWERSDDFAGTPRLQRSSDRSKLLVKCAT